MTSQNFGAQLRIYRVMTTIRLAEVRTGGRVEVVELQWLAGRPEG